MYECTINTMSTIFLLLFAGSTRRHVGHGYNNVTEYNGVII